MTYNLQDQSQAARIIQLIQQDITEKYLKISDFSWFLITIHSAISDNLKVELRYDVPNGLKTITGNIKSAEINYASDIIESCILNIDFMDRTTSSIIKLQYIFDAALVEENTNSVPGQFMKYYINNANHSVIVGIVVHYI